MKFRYCPATVSATALDMVSVRMQATSQECSAKYGGIFETTGVLLREGGWARRKSGDRSSGAPTRLRSEGNGGASMPFKALFHVIPAAKTLVILALLTAAAAQAASIRGVVTDSSGAKVSGATVSLFSNGQVVSTAASGADGSFQIITGIEGRFFLVVSATSFRQLETPDFYAGRLDNIERNLVLEPAWVHESIVVTATGTPTPQPQTGAATSVLGPLELDLREDLVSALRLMPGTFVVQAGQRGAQSSLFVREGTRTRTSSSSMV